MGININGYNLSNSSGLALGASSSKIDSSGRIIQPALPAMFGSRTNYGGSQNAYPWPVNDTNVNINSCWNGDTFTCPVAGVYFTSTSLITSGSYSQATSGYGGLIRNGGLYQFWHSNCADYWDTLNFQTMISCAAGDTLRWAVNVSPAPVGGMTGAYGGNHNMSTIFLMG